MSIPSQLDRISEAKNDIAEAIEEKGVTVPTGTKIDGMATLIRSIPEGITWELGPTMKLENNVLNVNALDEVQSDQQLPITSKAVSSAIESVREEKQDVIAFQYDQETETLELQL